VLANIFYRRPRLTALALGLILVSGLAAFESLPRQEDPTVSRRVATITTFLPGGSATRVEALVTEKIERRLQALHEIANLHSRSQRGVSVITIELDDAYAGKEVDEVWSRLRDRLADVQGELPPESTAPHFEDHTTTAATLIPALVWTRDDAPQLDLLTRLAHELEQRLRNLPGTRKTKLFGAADEEIRVTIDPLTLASVSLTASDVSHAIEGADTRVPAGRLRRSAHDLLIEVEGELDSVARIRGIPLRREQDGRLLRVGDIAMVEKTTQDPPSSLALIGGRAGVAVSVTMEPERRVDHWAAQAQCWARSSWWRSSSRSWARARP
jgi:multidrug efflux pump subunit AcrB